MIAFHPTGVTSLDPRTGEQYWSIPIKPAYEMSVARPMIEGNLMYASGIHDEAVMIELAPDRPAAEELWRGEPKEAIFSANATPLFVDGVLYGADCNVGALQAMDAADGKQLWRTFEPNATGGDPLRPARDGVCDSVGGTDRYVLMSETGDLLMARMTRAGYEPLGRFHVLRPTQSSQGREVVWSHPAYANRTAYLRNDEEIVAVDLQSPLSESH